MHRTKDLYIHRPLLKSAPGRLQGIGEPLSSGTECNITYPAQRVSLVRANGVIARDEIDSTAHQLPVLQTLKPHNAASAYVQSCSSKACTGHPQIYQAQHSYIDAMSVTEQQDRLVKPAMPPATCAPLAPTECAPRSDNSTSPQAQQQYVSHARRLRGAAADTSQEASEHPTVSTNVKLTVQSCSDGAEYGAPTLLIQDYQFYTEAAAYTAACCSCAPGSRRHSHAHNVQPSWQKQYMQTNMGQQATSQSVSARLPACANARSQQSVKTACYTHGAFIAAVPSHDQRRREPAADQSHVADMATADDKIHPSPNASQNQSRQTTKHCGQKRKPGGLSHSKFSLPFNRGGATSSNGSQLADRRKKVKVCRPTNVMHMASPSCSSKSKQVCQQDCGPPTQILNTTKRFAILSQLPDAQLVSTSLARSGKDSNEYRHHWRRVCCHQGCKHCEICMACIHSLPQGRTVLQLGEQLTGLHIGTKAGDMPRTNCL